MAKTQTSSTRSPLEIATGARITDEDITECLEMLNESARVAVTHVSVTTAPAGWGSSGNEVSTHGILFDSSSGLKEVYRGQMKIDPDSDTVILGATCTMTDTSGTDVGAVEITVGAASVTISPFNSGNSGTEQTDTLATSSTGTGKVAWTVEINHTSGGSADCSLDAFRIETQQLTSIADPTDE